MQEFKVSLATKIAEVRRIPVIKRWVVKYSQALLSILLSRLRFSLMQNHRFLILLPRFIRSYS